MMGVAALAGRLTAEPLLRYEEKDARRVCELVLTLDHNTPVGVLVYDAMAERVAIDFKIADYVVVIGHMERSNRNAFLLDPDEEGGEGPAFPMVVVAAHIGREVRVL